MTRLTFCEGDTTVHSVLGAASSFVTLLAAVNPAYPLFPFVAMDILFLWQLHAFVDGLRPPL